MYKNATHKGIYKDTKNLVIGTASCCSVNKKTMETTSGTTSWKLWYMFLNRNMDQEGWSKSGQQIRIYIL